MSGDLRVYGETPETRGHVTVRGADSRMAVGDAVELTRNAHTGGSLSVLDGALVTSTSGSLGGYAELTVAGTGSRWQIEDNLELEAHRGDGGDIAVSIADGAVVSANNLYLRTTLTADTHTTALTVSGNGTGLLVAKEMVIGRGSIRDLARVDVVDGGTLSGRVARVADGSGSSRGLAEVRVEGAGSNFSLLETMTVGANGVGTLTAADGGVIAAVTVTLGRTSFSPSNDGGAAGTINIGAASAEDASAPGRLDVGLLELATGGTLVFKHTSGAYSFDTLVQSFSNATGRIEQHAGTTRLDADAGGFSGATEVLGGTLVVNERLGGTVTVHDGATLGGSGNLLGSVIALDGATILTGSSPGVLTIEGDLDLDAGARLTLEIGGTEAGIDHDVLRVVGDASIAGVIELSFIGGFAPRTGQEFLLLDLGGAFDHSGEIDVLGLADGGLFEQTFDALSGQFSIHALNDGQSLTPVPLPPAAWLLGFGMAWIARAGRAGR